MAINVTNSTVSTSNTEETTRQDSKYWLNIYTNEGKKIAGVPLDPMLNSSDPMVDKDAIRDIIDLIDRTDNGSCQLDIQYFKLRTNKKGVKSTSKFKAVAI